MRKLSSRLERQHLRIGLVMVAIVGALLVVPPMLAHENTDKTIPTRVEPTDGVTVVTGQASPHGTGFLGAYAADGDLMTAHSRYRSYFDVDPSPAGDQTVLTLASERLDTANCGTDCYRLILFRYNISTGSQTTLHETHVAGQSPRWHDVDRLGPHRYLVGEIASNRVSILDTRTGQLHSRWAAHSSLSVASGGDRKQDWTHLNDVERLPDGRVMASLRNHDQVVFIHQNGTLDRDWTLGSDDAHGVLYEQHNPDYIPAERGGPAVVVADSENNRLVEYQRVDGGWQQTWTWQDARLSWPRDADRLPDGETLVADTHGGRVLTVAPNGSVTWSMSVVNPYDAERLGTGDESAGGQAAREIGLADRHPAGATSTVSARGGLGLLALTAINAVVPAKIVHAIQFVTPTWMSVFEVLGVTLLGTAVVGWLAVELRWSDYDLTVHRPVSITRED